MPGMAGPSGFVPPLMTQIPPAASRRDRQADDPGQQHPSATTPPPLGAGGRPDYARKGFLDRHPESLCAGVTFRRRLAQRARDHRIQRGGHARRPARRRLELIVHHRLADRRHRFARERARAGQHFVEDHPGGPDVGTKIHRMARGELLGRHIKRRPHDRAGDREFAVLGMGDAEIRQLHAAVGRQHDVARLDVAMHDVLPVTGLQSQQHAAHDLGDPRQRGFFLTVQHGFQRFAIDEFHDDEGLAIDFAIVMNLHHAGMRKLAADLGFLTKPRHQVLQFRGLLVAGAHHLDGDPPRQNRVPGFPDRSGGAASDRRAKLVTAQFIWHGASLAIWRDVLYQPAGTSTLGHDG